MYHVYNYKLIASDRMLVRGRTPGEIVYVHGRYNTPFSLP